MPVEPSSAVVLTDRAWFAAHPQARVRFRPERPGEFSPFEAAGHTVPAFAPPQFPHDIPLSWVAVIELTRLLGIADQTDTSSLRIRLRTVPIRSRALQRRLIPVYEQAVIQDFVRHHSTVAVAPAA